MNITTIPVKTGYFRAGEGYSNLVNALCEECLDGDIVFISETPVSTIEGNLVDESDYNAGITSTLITELWCKLLWGYILCPLLGYSKRTVTNLRKMPVEARNHKEFILREYGLKHALQPTAEAGVDLSNVPGSFVSLLPENPCRSVEVIKKSVFIQSSKNVDIVIIDTDPTYEVFGRYFTTLPKSVEEIHNDTGIFGYFLRSFTRKVGATPLASSTNLDLEELIEYANLCEDCQRKYSGNFFETVYNMKDTFDIEIDSVSVEMLDSVDHVPAVILRKG